jgi:methylaspartate mutase sigma subunit
MRRMQTPPEAIPVVTGVLQDNHNVGVRVLGYALERAGFRVIYVGARLTQEELLHAALETGARAILVSTSNGHAALDARGMRDKAIELGLEGIILYLGGNLAVDWAQQNWSTLERSFLDMGFDRVYPPTVYPQQVVQDLQADLGVTSGRPAGEEG